MMQYVTQYELHNHIVQNYGLYVKFIVINSPYANITLRSGEYL